MITSEYYANKLKELENLNYIERDIIPSSEPVFNVFLNTRKIEVPPAFRQIAMKGDHKAETIWFTLDRYFDGQDLADPSKKWAVQFINAKNEELLVPITYKYIGTQDLGTNNNPVQPNETLNEQTTLKLGWEITYDLTKESGKVQFSLRCFTIKDNNISYNLGTEMVTATIGNTLMISDTENPNIMDPPKDNLTHLVDRIEDLYKNNSLSKLNYNDLSEDTLPKIDDILLKGQHLTSADFKNISYNQLKDKPIYSINGEALEPGGNLELLTEADSALNASSTNPIQNRPVKIEFNRVDEEITRIDAAIAAINEELGNMTYIPLKIKSFTNNLNLLEKGSRYTGDCVFAWSLDGNLETLKLVNTKTNLETTVENPEMIGEATIAFVDLSDSVEYKLVVSDPKGKESSEITNIDFVYKLFYGKAPLQESYSESFLTETLTGDLSKTKSYEFTVNAGVDDYIYFCLPESYGTPKFWVGGFEGGITLDGNVIYSLNNTKYNIWKSTNKGLGETTVKVV